ncbi:MAG: XTP/dITP diphosphatase [Candidatus Sumerlaeia bacterium]|nr:XTP/dITP diphosphatase [Candidatus Sumerlaeia bacterium]
MSSILVLATRNAGKIAEFRQLLSGLDLTFRTLADYPDIGDIEEDGRTFAENAVKKAVSVALATGKLALADDSGLEVDALGGRPGIYSSRYAPTTAERNAKLLEELKDVAVPLRTARFVCVAALADPHGHAVVRTGVCEGRIAFEPSGTGGFGYDPLFFLPEHNKTMASLSDEEKNRISHRGKAIRALRPVLETVLREYGGRIPIP